MRAPSKGGDDPQVLIVSLSSDEHGTAVVRLLEKEAICTVRLSEADLRTNSMAWSPDGDLRLSAATKPIARTPRGLWRRPGSVQLDDIDPRFAHFAASESK